VHASFSPLKPGIISFTDPAESTIAMGIVQYPERMSKCFNIGMRIPDAVTCGKNGYSGIFQKFIAFEKISL
jgi:hypothetical protein